MNKSIIVKTCFHGRHKYTNAPEEVSFLRIYHDHNFTIEAEIEVTDSDRELEFFIVKRNIDNFLNHFRGEDFEFSCEQLAEFILDYLKDKYGERKYSISVFEDGVNGGKVSNG